MLIIQNSVNWIKRCAHTIHNEFKYNTWTEILLLFGLVVIIIMAIGFVILWPLALAWAINYLFHTNIPLNFTTWLAIQILGWAINYFFRNKHVAVIKWKK